MHSYVDPCNQKMVKVEEVAAGGVSRVWICVECLSILSKDLDNITCYISVSGFTVDREVQC